MSRSNRCIHSTLLGFVLCVVLTSPEPARGDAKLDSLKDQINAITEGKWNELIEPKLPRIEPSSSSFISWHLRLADPIPEEWPNNRHSLLFYAYARGQSFGLRDGEYTGAVWARVTVSVTSESEPDFLLLTDRIREMGRIGVRPLAPEEVTILSADPIALLLNDRTSENDKKIKAYYCLQRALGNIPNETEALHTSFFEWLDCP